MTAVSLTVRRAVAYLVDVTVLAALLVPIASLVALALGTAGLAGVDVWLRSLLLVSLPAWSYFVVSEHRWGRGVGKRLLGLRTSAAGTDEPPSWAGAFVRTAVTLLPWELVHLAFFALAPRLGEVTAPQVVVASLAYVLIASYLVATLRAGGGRSPADTVGGTEVRARREAG